MKPYVMKTNDNVMLVGKLDEQASDESYIVLHDPLEIKYRNALDGGVTAVFMKYNYFSEVDFVAINRYTVITVYPLASNYVKVYEESAKSINEEIKNKKSDISTSAPDPDSQRDDAISMMLRRAVSNTTVH